LQARTGRVIAVEVNNEHSRSTMSFFWGSAAKIFLCLFFYAVGFFWAISTAFPASLSFVISVAGLPLIAYSVFTVSKIPKKSRLMIFFSSVLITVFSPIYPYFPLIHNVLFIFPLITFLFLTIFIAIQQRTICAISASFLAGSVVTLIALSCILVLDHYVYSERWTIGVVLLFSTVVLIGYALIHKSPSGDHSCQH